MIPSNMTIPSYPNCCDKTSVAALRHIAKYGVPVYGQSEYNSEHLYQIANELEMFFEKFNHYRDYQPDISDDDIY